MDRDLELNTEFNKRKLERGKFKTTQQMPEVSNDITYERHVYSGPLGDGYTLVATKLVDGKKFIATEHYGPEARVDSGGLFIEVVEEVI
jgi:hypothetical protein